MKKQSFYKIVIKLCLTFCEGYLFVIFCTIQLSLQLRCARNEYRHSARTLTVYQHIIESLIVELVTLMSTLEEGLEFIRPAILFI